MTVVRLLSAFPGWTPAYLTTGLNLLNVAALVWFLNAARAADEEAARARLEEVRGGAQPK